MRSLVQVTLAGFVSYGLLLSALPLYTAQGGTRADAAGLVTTVMLVATVAVQTVVPALVRLVGMRTTLVAGLVALGAPSPLYLLDHSLGSLLAVSAVRGVGFAILTVLGSTITALIGPPERRGEAVGIYGLAVGLPNVVAVPAGAALTAAGAFGWVAWLGALPLLGVPAAVGLTRGLRSGAPPEPPDTSSRAAVLATLAPTAVLLSITFVGGGLLTFLPIERPSGALAAVALLLFGLTGALVRWLAGLWADRIGTRVLVPGFVALGALGIAAVGGGLAVGFGAWETLLVAAGALALGASYGAVQNLTLLVAFARTGPGHATTASAVWNAGFDLGTAIGAWAVGALAAAITLPWAYAACAVLLALVVPLGQTVARSRSTV